MSKVIKADRKNIKQESIEATLWQSADKLRKNMDAVEYKHVVLGLIFLKYISDAFEVLHSWIASLRYAMPRNDTQSLVCFWETVNSYN